MEILSRIPSYNNVVNKMNKLDGELYNHRSTIYKSIKNLLESKLNLEGFKLKHCHLNPSTLSNNKGRGALKKFVFFVVDCDNENIIGDNLTNDYLKDYTSIHSSECWYARIDIIFETEYIVNGEIKFNQDTFMDKSSSPFTFTSFINKKCGNLLNCLANVYDDSVGLLESISSLNYNLNLVNEFLSVFEVHQVFEYSLDSQIISHYTNAIDNICISKPDNKLHGLVYRNGIPTSDFVDNYYDFKVIGDGAHSIDMGIGRYNNWVHSSDIAYDEWYNSRGKSNMSHFAVLR